LQPDTIIPDQTNPQSWNRYTYVGDNPVNHNDPDGRCYPVCTAVIGAALGAIAGAVAYTVANQGQSFNTSEMLVAAGAGAVAGALIGTGVGLVAGATTAVAASAVAGTSASLISAGTAMAVTGGSYISQTSGGKFETKPFVTNTAVAGATAYLTHGQSLGTKLAVEFVGAEFIYLNTSKDITPKGFIASGLGGLAGGLFDHALGDIPKYMIDDISYSPMSLAYIKNRLARNSILAEGAQQRLANVGRTSLAGLISSIGSSSSSSYAQLIALEELP
jgi:hypothetical protein